jgi:glycosyltransferase involved in cell wall biosynthesis
MRIAIVIPAYQEAATVRGIAQRALAQCADVIVIDDGSTDGTAASVADLPVTLLRHPRNQGKAASLLDGFAVALARSVGAVATLDADGQHRPEDVARLAVALRLHPRSVIIGARMRERAAAPIVRRIGNAVADFFISWASGHRIVDSQSGQRLYPADMLQALVHDEATLRDTAAGFTLETALLFVAADLGHGVAAVPIDTVYARGARRSHFRTLRDTGRIARLVWRRLMRRRLDAAGLWRCLTQRPCIAAGDVPGPAPRTPVGRSVPRQG